MRSGMTPALISLTDSLRQPACAARGKRRAIVGAQVKRQAELAERRIQHRPDMFGVGARQRLAAQQIAAVGVGERQRLAAAAVAGQEPALEVDAPDVVGCPAMRKWCARGWTAPPQLALDRQPFAIKQGADRARLPAIPSQA